MKIQEIQQKFRVNAEMAKKIKNRAQKDSITILQAAQICIGGKFKRAVP